MPPRSSPKRYRPHSSEISGWFQRACNREEGALQQLLALYRPLLVKLAHQRVRGALRAKVGASDVVQATIWKATRHFTAQNFTEQKQFIAWLLSILKNEATDIRRQFHDAGKRSISRERPLFSPETKHWLSRLSARVSGADSIISPKGHTIEDLRSALKRLPAHYQLVLRFRYYEKLTFEMIGARLERAADAARVLHNRAIKKLRAELDRITEVSNGETP